MRTEAAIPDVTAVLTAHAEGSLARFAIRSAVEACRHAADHGIRCEIVVVLDRSNARTRDVVAGFSGEFAQTVTVDCGDPGLSRNAGIRAARGRYIALLDCDDLWGATWLTSAYELSERDGRPIVCHPEWCLYYSPAASWLHYHVDQEAPEFDAVTLVCDNYWTVLCFGARQTFLDIPFHRSDLSEGFGYEDWHWNCEVISAGCLHKTVLGTGHFVRSKPDGILQTSNRMRCIPRPSTLFARSARSMRGPEAPMGRWTQPQVGRVLRAGD